MSHKNEEILSSVMPQEAEENKEILPNVESSYTHTPIVQNAIKDFENVSKEIIQTVQNSVAMFE